MLFFSCDDKCIALLQIVKAKAILVLSRAACFLPFSHLHKGESDEWGLVANFTSRVASPEQVLSHQLFSHLSLFLSLAAVKEKKNSPLLWLEHELSNSDLIFLAAANTWLAHFPDMLSFPGFISQWDCVSQPANHSGVSLRCHCIAPANIHILFFFSLGHLHCTALQHLNFQGVAALLSWPNWQLQFAFITHICQSDFWTAQSLSRCH